MPFYFFGFNLFYLIFNLYLLSPCIIAGYLKIFYYLFFALTFFQNSILIICCVLEHIFIAFYVVA